MDFIFDDTVITLGFGYGPLIDLYFKGENAPFEVVNSLPIMRFVIMKKLRFLHEKHFGIGRKILISRYLGMRLKAHKCHYYRVSIWQTPRYMLYID